MPSVTPSLNQPVVPVTSSTTKADTKTTGGLGSQDFMKLLIAQLRNQDPLQPMEDKEFITQMAQFDSLEAMQSMNKSIQALTLSSMLSQAGSLLGTEVEANTKDGKVVGVVTGVSVADGQAVLEVGDKKVPMTAVQRVGIPAMPDVLSAGGANGSGTTTK